VKMKHKFTVAASAALTLIVIGCFAAQLWQQHNFEYTLTTAERGYHFEVSSIAGMNAVSINEYTLLAVPATLTLQTPMPSQTFLGNSTRLQIFDYINQNPGLQFRAIASALCLPIGLAEYHLGILIRSGLVSFVRDGRYKRFFAAKRFSKGEMFAICLLRHKRIKRIIETLLHRNGLSHCKLADEVSISSQALTWQMKTLRSTRFVLQVNDGTRTFYSLNEASTSMLEKCLAIVE
jgi:DNA-binding transcriptional ArsR family regulator